MKDNNNPIQELKPFRLGIDNLTEDNEINSNYSNDLHNCSDDLSNEGSIREEREHEAFAKHKKEELLNKTNLNYDYKTVKKSDKKYKKKSNLISILIMIWVIWSSVAGVMENFEETTSVSSELNYLEYEEMVETQKKLFEDSKQNIIINSTISSDASIILEINNLNDCVFNDITVQTIFYDAEDIPIKICDNYIDTLFDNKRYFGKIIDVPENYERFEFLITQPYVNNSKNVDFRDLIFNANVNDENNFDIRFTNMTESEIDSVEFVIVYYKNETIMDIRTDSLYDIKAGKTKFDTIYNFNDNIIYDRVHIYINDMCINE